MVISCQAWWCHYYLLFPMADKKRTFCFSFCPPSAVCPFVRPKKLLLTLPLSDVRRPTSDLGPIQWCQTYTIYFRAKHFRAKHFRGKFPHQEGPQGAEVGRRRAEGGQRRALQDGRRRMEGSFYFFVETPFDFQNCLVSVQCFQKIQKFNLKCKVVKVNAVEST